MKRTRIIALVALPVLLLGTGCRGQDSAPSTPGGSGDSVEQEFDDIESMLDEIESELAGG